jgi:ATP-dependent protease ClpP protease subunit
MQKAEAHIYFLDSIGMGGWFYGTTLNDVRYCVEGWAAYEGGSLPDEQLPAKVVLHFPACQGGDVVEGYGIYNYLRGLATKGVAIESRIEGLCASIATLVALAADTVLMADAALWMVHKPSLDGCNLDADDMIAAAELLNKIQAQIVSRYVARTGGKLDAATATELVNKESWLNADECLTYGFITGKLHEEPLAAPVGTEAVLNYYPTTKTPANRMATMTAQEEKSFLQKVGNFLRDEFGLKPKDEAVAVQPTTPPVAPVAPVVTNASEAVADNDPMYYADNTTLGVDSPVYSDEAMTLAYPDGDYTLADGRTATVAGGLITVLADAATEDNAGTKGATDLVAENAALKQQLDAALAAQNIAERKATAATNKLRQTVPGSAGSPTKPGDAQNMATTKPGAATQKAAGNMFSLTPPSTSTRK